MEGVLYLKEGLIERYNRYYALIDAERAVLVLRKKSYQGKEALSLDLQPGSPGKG